MQVKIQQGISDWQGPLNDPIGSQKKKMKQFENWQA